MKIHTKFLLLRTTLAIFLLLSTTHLAVKAQTSNLIQNGTFESGNLDLWEVCGGVRLADTQAGATALEVHEGRYALRLGNPTAPECEKDNLLIPQLQAYYRGIAVPNNATGLTLSFWYSRVGSFGQSDPGWALTVLLVTDDEPQVRILDAIFPDVTGGWNLARYELSAQELVQARGRTFYLYFDVDLPMSADSNLAYYIDELAVTPAQVRTPVETTPSAALMDDNTQPLVGFGQINTESRTLRSDLDGSNLRSLFEGELGNGGVQARWRPGGEEIGVLEHVLQTEAGEPISSNLAQITVLSVMDADGGNLRELYRTTGKKLTPGTPPGCRPPRQDCGPYDDPALDNVIADYAWSPDGSTIAINSCTNERYGDGFTGDRLCRIRLLDVATGTLQPDIRPALGVSWSKNNQLLYRVGAEGPLIYNTPQGIHQIDLNTTPMTSTLLFAHRQLITEDAGTTWSPDGRYFVTARFVEGYHYDSEGSLQFNTAIMRFDVTEPDNPQQLLLVDFGESIGAPTWSPDGRYILYDLSISDSEAETWWLEVATGKTGWLTSAIISVDWSDSTEITPLPSEQIYLPAMVK